MGENLDLLILDQFIFSRFMNALERGDSSISTSFEGNNGKNHEAGFEYACIGIEYGAFLCFINFIISMITKYTSEEMIDNCSQGFVQYYGMYCEFLKTCDLTMPSPKNFIEKRFDDYMAFYFGKRKPQNLISANNNPHSDNNTQNGFSQCAIAFNDFSLYSIKAHKFASYEERNSLIVLDALDTPFYSELFATLRSIAFSYLNLSLSKHSDFKGSIETYNKTQKEVKQKLNTSSKTTPHPNPSITSAPITNQRFELFINALDSAEKEAISYFNESNNFAYSCVILEFYALLEYFSICVDKTTGILNPNLMNSMLDESEKRSAHYCNIIDNIMDNPNQATFQLKIVRNRTADYEQIMQRGVVPKGFHLLSDYPRYENEIMDTLTRCSMAFCDFSIYHITHHTPAKSLVDIQSAIILGADECLYYQNIFSALSNIAFDYFSSSLNMVKQSSEQNNNLTKPLSVKYVPSDQKSNSIKNQSSIRDNIIYTIITIAALFMVSMIIISFLV